MLGVYEVSIASGGGGVAMILMKITGERMLSEWHLASRAVRVRRWLGTQKQVKDLYCPL